MMVGDDLHQDLTPERVEEVLDGIVAADDADDAGRAVDEGGA